MLITDNLSVDCIVRADRGEGQSATLQLMAALIAPVVGSEARRIETGLLDRERVRSTAFTNGVAVPHCRLPGLKRFGVGLLVLDAALRWDQDGHAVDTVLAVAGPSECISDHLRILANASQLLDSASIRAKLKSAPDSQRAWDLLRAAEESVERRRDEAGALREVRPEVRRTTETHLAEVADRFSW